jgi:hypothetical protein
MLGYGCASRKCRRRLAISTRAQHLAAVFRYLDGLKLGPAVQDRPSIKIILVSRQIQLSDMDRPAETPFFDKPPQVKQMIVELQQMVGRRCTLKIIPGVEVLTNEYSRQATSLHRAKRP